MAGRLEHQDRWLGRVRRFDLDDVEHQGEFRLAPNLDLGPPGSGVRQHAFESPLLIEYETSVLMPFGRRQAQPAGNGRVASMHRAADGDDDHFDRKEGVSALRGT